MANINVANYGQLIGVIEDVHPTQTNVNRNTKKSFEVTPFDLKIVNGKQFSIIPLSFFGDTKKRENLVKGQTVICTTHVKPIKGDRMTYINLVADDVRPLAGVPALEEDCTV